MVDVKESDITLQNYLAKVTFQSDPSPGNKLAIPDSHFILIAAILKLDRTLSIKK